MLGFPVAMWEARLLPWKAYNRVQLIAQLNGISYGTELIGDQLIHTTILKIFSLHSFTMQVKSA